MNKDDVPFSEVERIDEKLKRWGFGSYTVTFHQGKRTEVSETIKHKPQDY